MHISPRTGLEAADCFLETLAHANALKAEINEIIYGDYGDALVKITDDFICKAKVLALSAAVLDTTNNAEIDGVEYNDIIPNGKMTLGQLHKLLLNLTGHLDSYILYEGHFSAKRDVDGVLGDVLGDPPDHDD